MYLPTPRRLLLLLLHAPAAAHAALLWDGRFNELSSALDLRAWSWSNQTGPYQVYIHGNKTVDAYVELAPAHKNPADAAARQGAKFTLDASSYWAGQDMRRTELIPQTKAAINESTVFYHFSMMRKAEANKGLSDFRLHKICFFENGFSEMWSGYVDGDKNASNSKLRWMKDHEKFWEAEWAPGVWQNIAYEIDFTAKTVGFWHSTGGDDLKQAVAPVASNLTYSMGADWHLGMLEIKRAGYPDAVEEMFFSSVYIESANLTKTIGKAASAC